MFPRASLWIVLLALVGAASPVDAQEPPREGPLPPDVQSHVLELANRAGTLRLTGTSRIPAGARIQGDVVVLGGSLRLGGEVAGELVVVNGDLLLAPGANVTGAVWVLGGRVEGVEAAALAEPPQVYRAPLRYRVRGDVVEGAEERGDLTGRFLAADLGFGRTRFSVRAGGPYNRAEGLPVEFGPVIETMGRNPMVLRAFGIWRSVSGLDLDTSDMGYVLQLDQAVGGRGNLSVGAGLYSRIRQIEDPGITDLESSLATFLMTRDYRDHVEADGWEAHVEATPVRLPLRARLTFREESQEFAPVRDPWALGRGENAWRPQPLPATGTARFLEGELEWDARNDPDHATDGWWLVARSIRQVGGTLRDQRPPYDEPHTGIPHARLTWGSVDLRRYARVSPSSHLRARLLLRGSLTGQALPPQFQVALGGEGSLPGHPRFAVDCDARAVSVDPPRADEAGMAQVGHGCDRVSLVQLEFQRVLPLVWDPIPDGWNGSELAGLIRIQPALSVFLNAGQGWSHDRDGSSARTDSPRRADLGVGVSTGSVGVYWAYPINRRDRGLNFFVRLHHRF